MKLASKLGVIRGFGCIPEDLLKSFTSFPALNLDQECNILHIQNCGEKKPWCPISERCCSSCGALCPPQERTVAVKFPLKTIGNAEVRLKDIIPWCKDNTKSCFSSSQLLILAMVKEKIFSQLAAENCTF